MSVVVVFRGDELFYDPTQRRGQMLLGFIVGDCEIHGTVGEKGQASINLKHIVVISHAHAE